MKNILNPKTKIYINVILVTLVSFFVLYVTNLSSDLDNMIYKDFESTLSIFVFTFVVGLMNGYFFSVYSEIIMKRPTLIYNMMDTLTMQLFIFAILYFFLDMLFDNTYISMPYHLHEQNIILNLAIIFMLFFIRVYKKKNMTFNIKTLVPLAISFVLIIHMNYLELIFYGVFFGLLIVLKKIDHTKIISFLDDREFVKNVVKIALGVMSLFIIVYVAIFTVNLMVRFAYIGLFCTLYWIIFNRSKNFKEVLK